MRILIAQTDRILSRTLTDIFKKANCCADTVYSCTSAVEYAVSGIYDAIVLDITKNIDTLKLIRNNGCKTPVLLLTEISQTSQRIEGLNNGANYCLTKPFDTQELIACIHTITRTQSQTDTKIRISNITLDRATYILKSPVGAIKLANKEFQILEILMSSPNHIIPAEMFLEKIWGYNSQSENNIIWVYISNIRKKLSLLDARFSIKSSKNAGYYLKIEKTDK